MTTTQVEHHLVGIAILESMTVHAVVLSLTVGENLLFGEVLKATLINAHGIPDAVSRWDEAIGEPRVDLVALDVHDKRRESHPLAVEFLSAHCKFDVLVFVRFEQRAPFLFRNLEVSIFAFYLKRHVLALDDELCLNVLSTVELEVHRGDVARNGDIDIIGEDVGCLVDMSVDGHFA